MALPNVYTYVYGQIPQLFDKIKQGQAPDKFTTQYLKDIGFSSSNHRAFIPILKAIGFLSSDGIPTKRYHDYRNDALSRKILGQALKEAYSEIFYISAKPTEKDKKLIQGKFKSAHNTSDRNAELMTKTFFALLELADVEDTVIATPTEKSIKKKPKTEAEKDTKQVTPFTSKNAPSLHYNIQIHLPATKDIEVYNAIFKSLKENLIE